MSKASIADKIVKLLNLEKARAWDEGVEAAHARLQNRVHADGLIDQHALIKTPLNPYLGPRHEETSHEPRYQQTHQTTPHTKPTPHRIPHRSTPP
jgi:hypothetical protein